MEFARSFDAVVVGAGNGGLAAACTLAVDGRSVLLLERHNIPGGFSTSFVRGRFEFEASLHELCQVGHAGAPGAIRRLFDDLGVEFEWLPVPEAYRILIPGSGVDATMPFGEEAFLEAMARQVPGSREVTSRFLALCREIAEALAFIEESKGSASGQTLIKRFPNFIKTAAYSVEDVARALGMPQSVKDVLYAYWCYIGIPMSRVNMTLFAAMLHHFLVGGAYIPRLRSTEFALALERRIREAGGLVECGVEVEKILVEGGRAVGVRTASGESIGAGQVICNASPTAAYLSMVEPPGALPESARRWLGARRDSVSAMVVFLGLDASPDELGLKEYSYFVFDSMDTEALYESFSRLERPRIQATVCLNRAVPDCSPPGTTIMSFTVLTKPEAWESLSPADYFAKKSELALCLVEDFERATGLSIRDHIEEAEVSAPPTYARYTAAPGGLIYGYETDSWDSALPRMMMMGEDELVRGLKFASGYAMRTIGFSSALQAGRTAALLAERDLDAAKGGRA